MPILGYTSFVKDPLLLSAHGVGPDRRSKFGKWMTMSSDNIPKILLIMTLTTTNLSTVQTFPCNRDVSLSYDPATLWRHIYVQMVLGPMLSMSFTLFGRQLFCMRSFGYFRSGTYRVFQILSLASFIYVPNFASYTWFNCNIIPADRYF